MPKPISGLTQAARAAGMPAGGYLPTGQVRWLVARLHVSQSDLAVARGIWQRARGYAKPLRRAFVRLALREHRANQRLYRAVMRGPR